MRKFKTSTKNKGASSVLVILMMLVLVLFGLSALTAALASVRLTEKSEEWTGEFYRLESQAETRIAGMDRVLNESENLAVEYIENDLFLLDSGTILPDDLQKTIYMNMTGYLPKAAFSDYLERVIKTIYYAYAIEGLKGEFSEEEVIYKDSILRQILEDEVSSEVVFCSTVSENGKNIDIKATIEFPGYAIDLSSGTITGARLLANPSRYNIVVWKEWQEAFSYSEKVQYAEPRKD